jgi:hypothetical protein
MKTEPGFNSLYQALIDIGKISMEKIKLLEEQIRNTQLHCLKDKVQTTEGCSGRMSTRNRSAADHAVDVHRGISRYSLEGRQH